MSEEQNTDNDNEQKAKEALNEMNENSDNIHLHKTSEDGKEVDIDIDKSNKEVEVNIDSEKGHQKVNVNFSGVHVKGKDGKEVEVKFLPWVIFGVCVALAIISLLLFTIYSIFKLFA